MGRSLKKGPYIDEKLLKRVEAMSGQKGKRQVIKTWSRSCTIVP